MDLLEALNQAGAEFNSLAKTVGDDRGALPACGEWTVDELLAHMTGGCRMTVALMDGATAAEAAVVRAEMTLGPVMAALSDQIDRQFDALATPSVDLEIVHHPIIDMAPQQLIEIRLVEFVVHHWDLAMALDADACVNEQHAAIAWAAMEPLAEVAGTLGVFGGGPSGELDHAASAVHRLLDLTGRRV